MDLSALTLLKQSPNGQLELPDKTIQGAEGQEGGAEGFLQTLGEYLGKAETQEAQKAALNDLGNEFPSPLTGNDLPVNGGVPGIEGLELEGKENEGLDIRPDAVEGVDQSLSVFLSGLPSDFKNNSSVGERKLETNSGVFFDGAPINSRNNLLAGKPTLNNEQSILAGTVRKESEVLKAVGVFLQEKGVKTEPVINQLASSALKSTNLSHPEKEPFISTQSPLISVSEQTVAGKEQLQAMSKPLGHPDWGKELGDRVSWMANKTIQVAELRLNPARLGPVEVHIKTSQEQASIMFISPHAAVREALEQALPRLRDMMADQNFERVNVDVSQHSFDEKQASDNHSNNPRESAFFTETDGENEAVEVATSSHVIRGESLLSYYV